jgi:hypothetical protein
MYEHGTWKPVKVRGKEKRGKNGRDEPKWSTTYACVKMSQ